jgi:EAL domain-containing protein (putative c-di-GMP-specific phosphodiesterase class I)
MRARSILELLLQPRALRAVFQPVVDLSQAARRVHYHEGLVRGPRGTNVERPDVLFEYARRKLAETEVDRAAVRAVLMAAGARRGEDVGLNVHRTTVAHDRGFAPFLGETLAAAGIRASSVVLEMVEQGDPCDLRALLPKVEALRRLGVRIALDDFGTGHANYLMVLECRPEYLKIDRRFVHGCHQDVRRQAFLESLVTLAGRVGARVVAEGIEVEKDLERVRRAGISLVQGFLLGRPSHLVRVAAPSGTH